MRKKQRRAIQGGGDQWHGVHVAEHDAAVADDIHVHPARESKLPDETTNYSGDRMTATHTPARTCASFWKVLASSEGRRWAAAHSTAERSTVARRCCEHSVNRECHSARF